MRNELEYFNLYIDSFFIINIIFTIHFLNIYNNMYVILILYWHYKLVKCGKRFAIRPVLVDEVSYATVIAPNVAT